MTAKAKTTKKRWMLLIIAITLTALVTATITALGFNIAKRQAEGRVDTFTKVVDLDETTVDPAVWGQNFPLQYETYMQTAEMVPTTHAGSPSEPHTPTAKDPRTRVATSRIEEDPRLKKMWAGYAFSVDYRHARGHHYMLEDQRYTMRVTDFKQPGTCLNCHASTVPVMDKLGNGDREKGFHAMNAMTYNEVTKLAEHPVGCIDCHDPKTMELRVTRPAFIHGIKNLKASEGVDNFDVNRDATHQEMRTYVCAQCHVEYYFKGEGNTLTFPWDKGIDIDDIWDYYQEAGHVDFEHKTTGAKILKAQHPEFDLWSNGIHAANGVSCADCHMPYQADGAKKVSNHHLQSPLHNVNASCLSCHHASEEEMIERVETIQDRFIHSRDQAFDSLVLLIDELTDAVKNNSATPEQIEKARQYQNKASFYLDYVYSENSYGFHAPDYIQRIVSDSLDASRKGSLVLKGIDETKLDPSDVTTENQKAAVKRGN